MSNTVFHLYGTEAIQLLVALCKRNNWQAFDTSLGKMLNFDKSAENGHSNFVAYLTQIKRDT